MNEKRGGPQAESGIGRRLKRAREKSGLSFERVERSTKIRARYLRELERENFDVLPAVYVLGSLKTYADALGLDGAALSRELKEHLEPEEPEAADAANPLDPEEDYEAAPAAAVGFNQLFLGMGVLIVSVLAIMTLVSAVAQNAGPTKVSQMDEPSVQKASQGLDLAGNVNPERNPERDPRPQNAGEAPERETGQRAREGRGDEPKPPKDERDGNEKVEELYSAESLFGDVEFVPVSPPSSAGFSASGSGASASASTGASAGASAGATSATAGPASDPTAESAAPSAFSRSSDEGASSVPSDGFSSASPSGSDGDLRPGPEDGGGRQSAREADSDGVSDRIVADVERELREDGID